MPKSYYQKTKIPKITATKIKIEDDEPELEPDREPKPEEIRSKSEDSDQRKSPPMAQKTEPTLEQFVIELFLMVNRQHEILEGL